MRLPPSVLDDIKARFDMVQYVSRYVDLKRAGSNFKGLCPFHQEKSPSFMVNPSKGIFKCFGCGQGGDIISFLRGMEALSFGESVRLLAQEAGVDLTEYDSPEAAKDRNESDRLFKMNDEARRFYTDALETPGAEGARAYLERRAILASTCKDFSIGYAPSAGNALLHHLRAHQFTDEELVQGGLAIQRDNGECIDKFRNRIVIPIQNLSGLTCGFTGRVLSDDEGPKYLNSPETVVFKKGNILFGLLQARDAVKQENILVLVEGNFDLITLSQGGIAYAAATSGTALTDRQALLIKRFTDRVTLIYDGDNAGQAATARGLPVLINAGLMVRVAVLPKEEDPDSYLRKHGREAFVLLIKEAQDIVDFTYHRFTQQNDPTVPENKAKLVTEIAELLRGVSDPVLRGELLKKASSRTGVSETLILGRAPVRKRAPYGEEAQSPMQPMRDTTLPPTEERLLELLIHSCEACFNIMRRYLREVDFSDPTAKALYQAIMEHGEFHSSLLSDLSPEAADLGTRIAMKAMLPLTEAALQKETKDIILRIREKALKRERNELMQQVKQAEAAEKEKFLVRFHELTQELNNLKEINELTS